MKILNHDLRWQHVDVLPGDVLEVVKHGINTGSAIIHGMPTTGKTGFLEKWPSNAGLILDSDVVFHWVCGAWANVHALRYQAEDVGNLKLHDLDRSIEKAVWNMTLMIQKLADCGVITNLRQPGVTLSFGRDPKAMIEMHEVRMQDKIKAGALNSPKEDQKWKSVRFARLADSWMSDWRQSAVQQMKAGTYTTFVELEKEEYISTALGLTADLPADAIKGDRSYAMATKIVNSLVNNQGLMLNVPQFLKERV